MPQKWQVLKPGNNVYIVAPAGGVDDPWEEFEKSCDYLRSLDLVPIYSKNIFSNFKSYYRFANTDEKRYHDFITAVESDAAAILSYRGGYGCDRVIDLMIKNQFKPSGGPKLFVGFSDCTNLHSYITQQWDWATLHGPGFRQIARGDITAQDKELYEGIVFGKIDLISLDITPMNNQATRKKLISSEIIGGNLATIQAAINTPWSVALANKILLLEDINEAPYQISRMLYQFHASLFLTNCTAVVLGDFIYKNEKKAEMELVLKEFAAYCPVPVFSCPGIGHGKNNHPVPLATSAQLILGEKASLIVETGSINKKPQT